MNPCGCLCACLSFTLELLHCSGTLSSNQRSSRLLQSKQAISSSCFNWTLSFVHLSLSRRAVWSCRYHPVQQNAESFLPWPLSPMCWCINCQTLIVPQERGPLYQFWFCCKEEEAILLGIYFWRWLHLNFGSFQKYVLQTDYGMAKE